jgi:hypothetical protein
VRAAIELPPAVSEASGPARDGDESGQEQPARNAEVTVRTLCNACATMPAGAAEEGFDRWSKFGKNFKKHLRE